MNMKRIGALARAARALSGRGVLTATDKFSLFVHHNSTEWLLDDFFFVLFCFFLAIALCDHHSQKVREGALVPVFPAI
jgi:hypothetical protein